MESVIIELMISLVVTGSIGYFSYYLLNTNDLLRVSKNKTEEKRAVILILTVINLIFLYFANLLVSLIFQERLLIYVSSCLISLIISLIFGLNIFPWLLRDFFKSVNKRRKKEGKREFTNQSIRDCLLDTSDDIYSFIFTLDGKYIAEGWIDIYQYDCDEYYELSLFTPDKQTLKTVETVEKFFENEQTKK